MIRPWQAIGILVAALGYTLTAVAAGAWVDFGIGCTLITITGDWLQRHGE